MFCSLGTIIKMCLIIEDLLVVKNFKAMNTEQSKLKGFIICKFYSYFMLIEALIFFLMFSKLLLNEKNCC